jgi:hypothetical protein
MMVLGNLDLDAPLYRVFPLWFFEEALRLGQLVLVDPDRWEDPFEQVERVFQVVDTRTNPWTMTIVNRRTYPYAQSWSMVHASDTLLRAYSRVQKDPILRRNTDPRNEGVRVRTTARRLCEEFDRWARDRDDVSMFVGAVVYGTGADKLERLAQAVRRNGAAALETREMAAQLLLLKRKEFQHEAEVRVVCISENEMSKDGLLRVPVPLSVLDEVSFDPRLEVFERREREAAARSLGYEGSFFEPTLYQKVFVEVVVD